MSDDRERLVCPKCGSVACRHGMEPVTLERFAELHSSDLMAKLQLSLRRPIGEEGR